MSVMHETWRRIVEPELSKPYFVELQSFLRSERETHAVFPPEDAVFAALDTPLDCVRAVILGQDPYHGPGQAHGLSFSVPPGIPVPPSLVNIYKELHDDVGVPIPKHGNLRAWARRGVMLLNTTLTVRSGEPMSHANRGWETFTNCVIDALSNRRQPMAFILWGQHAQGKAGRINNRHALIMSAHPSPMSASRGFFGSRPFRRVNCFLAERCVDLIDWSIPEDPFQDVPMAAPVTEPKAVVGPDLSSL